ncbi:MAG: DedA family protein [Actinomycetota bacterium]
MSGLTYPWRVLHTLGPSWLNPETLLETFGPFAFWGTVAVVFIECGLFFFLLPGDSLLFTVGLFIAEGSIDVSLPLALVVLVVAAIGGNAAGYEIGRAAGPRIVRPGSRLVKQAHIDQTYAFFDRYGARALILGRFVPIVRTFITLVAGIGRMDRRRFYLYTAIGAVIWAAGVTTLGYFLGTIPFVRNNLEVMLLTVVAFSLVPIAVEWIRYRRGRNANYDEEHERQRVVDETISS